MEPVLETDAHEEEEENVEEEDEDNVEESAEAKDEVNDEDYVEEKANKKGRGRGKKANVDKAAPKTAAEVEFDAEMEKQRLQRLNFLLEKTSLYSNFLSQKLAIDPKQSQNPTMTSPEDEKKRKRNAKDKENGSKKQKGTDGTAEQVQANMTSLLQQPSLITGASLRPYQLKGVEWLISLYENGLNGILADEMGLGKTIQCISLLAHLIEHGVKGPFLIVGPLSTLANWIKEFKTKAPTIPVLMYHGNKDERSEMRDTQLKVTTAETKKGTTITLLPIIVTSYEIVMRDRKYLQKFKWKYIIVDEGHRIKNLNSKLIKELKSYQSANRLLLTGTPLQNNLTELWSLLNFLLPDIFDDLESFQNWFDFSAISEQGGSKQIMEKEQQNQVVTKLHQILRPFLLRRVKDDVELNIPKKSEKTINTKLTKIQHKYYQAVLNKSLNSELSEKAVKQLKNKGTGLQNMLMQLRKACNHPYLFEWPEDEDEEEIIDEKIITSSGKMQVLDRILTRMKKEGHRVLIFSQMTRMLDILEDYMNYKEYSFVRLDGSTAQMERQESIEEFTTKDVFCFLLSTRAGGLGINLTAADTVIFYDNDWNPQVDLQAQDRCHRIGQTRPVRVYKLVTANSVESRILKRANDKMKLDRLVIQKGNFTGVKSKSAITEISELEQVLVETPDIVGKAEDITDDFLFVWKDNEEVRQSSKSEEDD